MAEQYKSNAALSQPSWHQPHEQPPCTGSLDGFSYPHKLQWVSYFRMVFERKFLSLLNFYCCRGIIGVLLWVNVRKLLVKWNNSKTKPNLMTFLLQFPVSQGRNRLLGFVLSLSFGTNHYCVTSEVWQTHSLLCYKAHLILHPHSSLSVLSMEYKEIPLWECWGFRQTMRLFLPHPLV